MTALRFLLKGGAALFSKEFQDKRHDYTFHHMAFNSALLPFLIQQLDPPQKEQLQAALADMDLQLRKLADIPWLWQLMEPCDEEVRRTKAVFP